MEINKNHAVGFPQVKANVKHIFIHNAWTTATAYAVCNQDKTSKGFNNGNANFYVDDKEIWESVPPGITTWHCGNYPYNQTSIGIEICRDKVSKAVYMQAEANALALAAELCKKYKLKPTEAVIMLHMQVYATACSATSKKYYGSYNNVKKEFIKKIKIYMEGGSLMQKVTLDSVPWDVLYIKLTGDRKMYSSIPTSVNQAKNNAKFTALKGHIHETQGIYTYNEYEGIDAQGRKVPFTRVEHQGNYYYMPIYRKIDINAKKYSGTPDKIRHMKYEEE